MNSACTKQVGSGHCNIAFLPGLANYPTDTVRDERDDGVLQGEAELHVHGDAARRCTTRRPRRGVAQTFFTANKNVNVFATFGDQMAAGAMTAMKLVGGYTPGKNIAIIGYGGAKEIVNQVKTGTCVRHPRPVPGL